MCPGVLREVRLERGRGDRQVGGAGRGTERGDGWCDVAHGDYVSIMGNLGLPRHKRNFCSGT